MDTDTGMDVDTAMHLGRLGHELVEVVEDVVEQRLARELDLVEEDEVGALGLPRRMGRASPCR